jgi:tRNA-dihydrouridine synthase
MRKHMAWYMKGLPGSARIKDNIMEETSRDNMVAVLNQYIESLPDDAHKPISSNWSDGEAAAQ